MYFKFFRCFFACCCCCWVCLFFLGGVVVVGFLLFVRFFLFPYQITDIDFNEVNRKFSYQRSAIFSSPGKWDEYYAFRVTISSQWYINNCFITWLNNSKYRNRLLAPKKRSLVAHFCLQPVCRTEWKMIRDSSFCLFMIKEFKTLKPATIPCPTIPRRPFLFTARVQVIRYASFRWTKIGDSCINLGIPYLFFGPMMGKSNVIFTSKKRGGEHNVLFLC